MRDVRHRMKTCLYTLELLGAWSWILIGTFFLIIIAYALFASETMDVADGLGLALYLYFCGISVFSGIRLLSYTYRERGTLSRKQNEKKA